MLSWLAAGPEAGEEVAQSFTGLKGSYEVMKLDLSPICKPCVILPLRSKINTTGSTV